MPLHSFMEPRPSPSGLNIFAGIALALALYFSGFFVVLTPLPLLYALARDRARALTGVFLPSIAGISAIYFLALPQLQRFYAAYPGWEWVFPVPGMTLLKMSSVGTVALFGIGYYLFYVVIALIAYRFFAERESMARLAIYAMGLTVAAVAAFEIYARATGQSSIGMVSTYYQEVVGEFLAIQKQSGMPAEQVAFFEQNGPTMARYMLLATPSLLFGFVFLTCVVNFMLISKFLLPFLPLPQDQKIGAWKLPFAGVWVVIAFVALLLGTFYGLEVPLAKVVAINGLLIAALLYYLQGLAIVAFFLDKKNVRPLLRLAVYVMLLVFIQPLGFFVVGLGFFDSWWNLRKIAENPAI